METESSASVYEDEGALLVEVGLPGVPADHLDVLVQGSRLVIRAVRPGDDRRGRTRVQGRWSAGAYAHELHLPPEACLALATATYVDGLLRVHIPFDDATGPLPGGDDWKPPDLLLVRAGRASERGSGS